MPCRAVPDAPRPAKAVPRAGGRFRHRPGAYGGTPHAPRFCCVFRACGKTALSGFDPRRTEAFPELLTVQETPGWHSAPRGRPPGFDRYRAAEPAAIRCRTFSHGKRPRRHPDCPAPQTGFRLLHQKAVQLARRGEKRCTIARQLRKTMYSPRADLFRSLLFGKGSSACGRTLSVKPLCARPACAYSAGGRHAFTFSAISR